MNDKWNFGIKTVLLFNDTFCLIKKCPKNQGGANAILLL